MPKVNSWLLGSGPELDVHLQLKELAWERGVRYHASLNHRVQGLEFPREVISRLGAQVIIR